MDKHKMLQPLQQCKEQCKLVEMDFILYNM